MISATQENLFEKIGEYLNEDEIKKVKQAYEYAKDKHKDQYRQSGEPYIVHPVTVAYILSELHADSDTICAGLLHDTLEDTTATKEEITELFGEVVTNLVDGVTKISKMNFSTKEEQNLANTRKIITSIMIDVRIIIIKLADRLHNMRTLEHKSEFKQKENSLETLDIFVPLAYYIGAYRIKSELEDISLHYLKPNEYKEISEKMQRIEEDSKPCLEEMLKTIKAILDDRFIPNEIKVRTKNIYGVYRLLESSKDLETYQKSSTDEILSKMHDLLSLKIMVDSTDNCYQTLGIIHSKYHPVDNSFKDYLYNPKRNMYRSLHTTVFGPEERLVQSQIRTFSMDKIASFGLTAYWYMDKGNARNLMQTKLTEELQFYKSLRQIDKVFSDNEEFVDQVKKELFSTPIYVYTPKGEAIELPNGSTPVDFAYQIHTAIGNKMVGAYVNDEPVPIEYSLSNKDRVKIVTDNSSAGPKQDWIDVAHTTKAKRKIKEYLKN